MHTPTTVTTVLFGRRGYRAPRAVFACLLAALPLSLTSCNRSADKAAIRTETQRADSLRQQLAEMKTKEDSTRERLDVMRHQAALTPTLTALQEGHAEVEKRRTELTAILKGLQDANRNLRLEVDSARKTSVAGTR